MITSFRLRLALLSALLAGLALIAFGGGSWWLIRNIKIERIDSEVRSYAEREVNRARRVDDWQRVEARLLANLGIRDGSDLVMLVQDDTGETLYRSSHWPSGLDAEGLPWPLPRRAVQNTSQRDLSLVSGAYAATPEQDAASLDPPRPPRTRGRTPRREGFAPDNPPPRLESSPADASADVPGQPPTDQVRTVDDAVPRDGLRLYNQPPGPPPISAVVAQTVAGQIWRIGMASNGNSRVALAINVRIIEDDMKGIRNAFFLSLPLALILIGLGSWIFSSRAMQPLQKLADATKKVTAEDLGQRIPDQGEDHEFAELIRNYNRMLERLERSFKQAHRFSADAAHELKTPLAILQGQLERSINNAEGGSAMQEELTGILDEIRRLSTISRKLLLLSQADAGGLNLYRQPFRLSSALEELVEDTCMLAPQLKVTAEIQPDIVIDADGGLLLQVLHNLISNAIKYNVDNGWIHISTAVSPKQVEVIVANASQGIPESERGKVFERFYRADPSHSRQIEGVGLGLSVSREIARAHRGDITLMVDDEGNVQFILSLPFTGYPKQKI